MASQSALRARVATIRELLAPDTSKQPCASVYINRQVEGPLLLTAGEEPTAETRSPAAPTAAHNCGDGHVCGPHCVVVSINFAPRGDGDRPQTPVDASAPPTVTEGVLESARAPAGVYGDGGAVGNAPASEATVEMRRIYRPAAELPPPPDRSPYSCRCGCAPYKHTAFRYATPCCLCGFSPEQHRGEVDLYAGVILIGRGVHRLMPCGAYRAVANGDRDVCDGCDCPGFRPFRFPLTDEQLSGIRSAEIQATKAAEIARLAMERAAKEEKILALERQLAELQAAAEAAKPQPSSLGDAPRSCPVFQGEP